MRIETLQRIIGNSISEEDAELVYERAKKLAINHFFWKEDDEPQSDEIERFVSRYDYEICDLAKAIYDNASRGGMKQFSELGVTRVWETGGDKMIANALSAIPVQTYVW